MPVYEFGYSVLTHNPGNVLSNFTEDTNMFGGTVEAFLKIFDISIVSGAFDFDNAYLYSFQGSPIEVRLPVTSNPARIEFTAKKVSFKLPCIFGMNAEGVWDETPYRYYSKNEGYLRVDEPATGKWIQIYTFSGIKWPGETTATSMTRITCSDPANNYESMLSLYGAAYNYIEVLEDGRVAAFSFYGQTTTDPFFTAGNELVPTWIYTSDDASAINLWWMGYCGDIYSGTFSIPHFTTPIITCTGQISGPCIGEASAPVANIEYIWAGRGCNQWDGLRYANVAQPGRNGFLFDDYAAYNYLIQMELFETEPYFSCLVDGDGLIQSTCNNPSTGIYSTYKLSKAVDPLVSVFNSGSLEGSNLDFTFNTDRTEVDLNDKGVNSLVGPKNIINFGVTGASNYYLNYLASTMWTSAQDPDYYWKPESGFNWDADETGTFIGEDSEFAYALDNIYSRNPAQTLYSESTVNPVTIEFYGKSIKQVGDDHFVFFKHPLSGSTYTITLELYKWNFTTELAEFVASYSIGTRAAPLVFPINACQLLFVPSHGTNGRLYVGDPEYTGSKTNQGRVRVYDFTGSALSFNQDISSAIRNGFEGSCISYDPTSNTLMVGQEDSILTYNGSTYAAGAIASPGKGGLSGRHFGAGSNGYVVMYTFDNPPYYTRLYQYTSGTWYSRSNYGWGGNPYEWSYCNNPIWNETYNVWLPRIGMCRYSTAPAHFTTSYSKNAASNEILSGSPSNPAFSTLTTDPKVAWYTNPTSTTRYEYSGGVTRYLTVDINPDITDYFTYTFSACAFNNGSDEYLVLFYYSSDRSTLYYDPLFIGETTAPHTEVGNWYVEATLDLSNTTSILSSAQTFDIPDTSCNITFCFKLDTDTDYWVPTGIGSFSQYSNFEDARANACAIDLFDDYMSSLDIDGVTTLTMYIFLEKTLDLYNRLTTPKITQLLFEFNIPPLAEPIICLHFNNNEIVKEVYKNTSEILTIITPAPALSQGVDMIVTGTYCRPLFS
jgi:hypothetical protein